MKNVKVLGTGCAKCRATTQLLETVARDKGVEIELEKVEEPQDIMRYEIEGEDKDGKLIGTHRGTGVGRPRFWERARYFNLDADLGRALDALEEGSR